MVPIKNPEPVGLSLSCFHSSSYIVSTGSRFQRRGRPFTSQGFGGSITELSQLKPWSPPWQLERWGATVHTGRMGPFNLLPFQRGTRTHEEGKAPPEHLTLEKSGLLNLWNVLRLPASARSSQTWQEWEKKWVGLAYTAPGMT